MSEHNEYSETSDEQVSKSQIKRDLLELQKVGERLVGMKPDQLNILQLTSTMLEALEESRRITSRNALRRHIRRIAKLLQSEDMNAIRSELDKMDNRHLEDARRFKVLEQWRERLLSGGDEVLNELVASYQDIDRQHLRQLVRAALREQKSAKPGGAAKKIFRYLKELGVDKCSVL